MRDWGRLLAWISLLTILAILPLILGSGVLPDPMATHWGLDGRPNGSMSQAVVPLLTVGLMLIALLITGVFTRQGRPSAEAVALAGVFGGIAISLNVSVVILNAGASSWEDAADFDWWHITHGPRRRGGLRDDRLSAREAVVSAAGDRARRGARRRARTR